jgi:hypothetical protein
MHVQRARHQLFASAGFAEDEDIARLSAASPIALCTRRMPSLDPIRVSRLPVLAVETGRRRDGSRCNRLFSSSRPIGLVR